MAEQPQTKASIQLQDKDLELLGDIEKIPTIYIDGMQGLMGAHGVVKIGLYQYIQAKAGSPEGAIPTAADVKKLLVGRLVLPEAAVPGIAEWLAKQTRPKAEKKSDS